MPVNPVVVGTTAVVVSVVGFAAPLAARQTPPGAQHVAPAFTFNRIADDIYHAVGTGSLAVGANAAIVINEADVLLVDSHVSPAAAHVLLEELKAITTKPVRYVVNTHFHYDHAHGNQIYPPTVEIIGHEFTRQMMASGGSTSGRAWDRGVRTLPDQIRALKMRLDTISTDTARAALERRLRILGNYWLATDAVRPAPPTITLDHTMTLFRGGREIRLAFFGRGHTGGDVVVHLPRERVLISGDLLNPGLSYMGDGFVPDWIETLEKLKGLEFDVVLPGHGQPFRDRRRIDYLQAYLRDFWAKVAELHRAGVPAADAARRIDMRAHAQHYPSITAVGVDADAVARAYEVLGSAR